MVALAIGAEYLYSMDAFGSRPRYDETWAKCESDDRCTAIRAPCETWVAVNDSYLDDASAYYDHTIKLVEDSPQIMCPYRPQSDIQPKAYCLSGQCIIAP